MREADPKMAIFNHLVARKVALWQQCPHTPTLTCSMDPDHLPMLWDTRGFLQCPEETCGYIRYGTDLNPQILTITHGAKHRDCIYQTGSTKL